MYNADAMNTPTFRLFWLRETGCDAGVVREAGEIEHSIRERVLALTGGESGEFGLRLPYLDRHQWHRRSRLLSGLEYERVNRVIRAILPPAEATRDMAATLALADPAWKAAPRHRHPGQVYTWQRVSAAVQGALKHGMASEYFRDLSRLEKKEVAGPMIVFQCSRVFTTKIRNQYTYDLRGYPDCRGALIAATTQIGIRVRRALAEIHQRLVEDGQPELAQRYAPAWSQDLVDAVRRRPKRFLDLLVREAAMVSAVIELGLDPSPVTVGGCARTFNKLLRAVQGADLRRVGVDALEAAARALPHPDTRGDQDVFDGGVLEDGDMSAARGPDERIGGE